MTTAHLVGAQRFPTDSTVTILSQSDDSSANVVSVGAGVEKWAYIVADALEHGKHVLFTLPTTATAEDLDLIDAAATNSSATLMPALHHRFHPAVLGPHSAVRSGRIGLPWNVQVDWLVSGTGDPAELLRDIVDAVQVITACPVRRVNLRATMVGETSVFIALFDHDHGLTSTATVGFLGEDATPLMRYRVSGSHGVVTSDGQTHTLRVSTPGLQRLISTEPDDRGRMMTEFLACVESGRTPDISLRDARRIVSLVSAAQQSLHTGKWIDLEIPAGT